MERKEYLKVAQLNTITYFLAACIGSFSFSFYAVECYPVKVN
jgi:hypothetical protein